MRNERARRGQSIRLLFGSHRRAPRGARPTVWRLEQLRAGLDLIATGKHDTGPDPRRVRRASPPVLALAMLLILVGCQGTEAPTSSPSRAAPPTPTSGPGAASPSPPPHILPAPTDGPEKLIVDLEAIGADARLQELFAGDPFPATGTVMCVGSEPVRLYVFGSIRDRMDAAAMINPADPSDLETSMVTWNGRPRMWQRDRMLVVYLGEDPATETLLKSVLGAPFASGPGRMLLPDRSCD